MRPEGEHQQFADVAFVVYDQGAAECGHGRPRGGVAVTLAGCAELSRRCKSGSSGLQALPQGLGAGRAGCGSSCRRRARARTSSTLWLASHSCRAMYRPRPVPCSLVVKKAVKICSATRGGMPGPRSITSIDAAAAGGVAAHGNGDLRRLAGHAAVGQRVVHQHGQHLVQLLRIDHAQRRGCRHRPAAGCRFRADGFRGSRRRSGG